MDKEWQDIYFEKIQFKNPYNKVIWGIREIHIINIKFNIDNIEIIYRDVGGNLHTDYVPKLEHHRLVIE